MGSFTVVLVAHQPSCELLPLRKGFWRRSTRPGYQNSLCEGAVQACTDRRTWDSLEASMDRFKKVLSSADTAGLVEEGAFISEERTDRDVRVVCKLGGIYGGEDRDVLYVIPGRFTGRPNEAPSPIFMPGVVD